MTDLSRDDLIYRRDHLTALGSKDRAAYDMALRTHDAEADRDNYRAKFHDAEQRRREIDDEAYEYSEKLQRSEAKCERLRRSLQNVMVHTGHTKTSPDRLHMELLEHIAQIASNALATPPPEGEPEKCPDGLLPDGETCPRCGGKRAPSGIGGGTWVHADAPHAPEQASYDDHVPSTHPQGDQMGSWPEQAHGDALAALVDEIAPPIPPFNNEAEEEEYHCESAVRHYSERVREKLRRHLTASGVPYVPEEVRRLPEKWRDEADDIDRQAEDAITAGVSNRHLGRAVGMRVAADELESALASAPAEGYKLVPVEPTEEMVRAGMKGQIGESLARHTWERMIAAAPTDGRE